MLPVSSVTDKSINVLNGLISFLREQLQILWGLLASVNALNGLISFLHPAHRKYLLRGRKCVNALNGLISFLRLHFQLLRQRPYGVSMP